MSLLSPISSQELINNLATDLEAKDHGADSLRKLSRSNEWIDEEKKIPDDFLPKPFKTNRVSTGLTTGAEMDAAQVRSWELVLQDNWNTNKPFYKPELVPPLTAQHDTILIGLLDIDAEISRKRKADNTPGATKSWRAAGAAVFIKVNTIREQEDITFPL
ncbi:uncharacterized protein CTRU02_200831 [Colletotrichum truncatum]|uniref:Uncharacterized protein n=1 Tax=Colletotrichum truncatum TaxID=5467 RepID=A0ACC3ZG00_COLTU